MNGIYEFLDLVGFPNIGIAIIIFTFLTKALMLPMSIKQQKFSKLNTVMAPELQEIQSKYKNLDKNSPKYNEMLMKQQSEMKEVYEKYGTSPMSGCGQFTQKLADLRGQTERNIRKVRDTVRRRIQRKLHATLTDMQQTGDELIHLEQDFLRNYTPTKRRQAADEKSV